MVRVQTHNHLYTLTDAGDGGWYISGHPKYCPSPLLCTLRRPPSVGWCVLVDFAAPDKQLSNPMITTPVVEVLP